MKPFMVFDEFRDVFGFGCDSVATHSISDRAFTQPVSTKRAAASSLRCVLSSPLTSRHYVRLAANHIVGRLTSDVGPYNLISQNETAFYFRSSRRSDTTSHRVLAWSVNGYARRSFVTGTPDSHGLREAHGASA